jgi:YHS domain-containing protein
MLVVVLLLRAAWTFVPPRRFRMTNDISQRLRIILAFGVMVATAAVTLASAGKFTAEAAGKMPVNTIGLKGVAIKGYDAVAYFTKGAPSKGSKQFSLQHQGAEWRFASAEHKALFAANPEKYIPAYGGYCAYGVAQGHLVKIEPDAWAIRDGKLYLNYDSGVQRTWSKRPARYISTANQKWPALIGKK